MNMDEYSDWFGNLLGHTLTLLMSLIMFVIAPISILWSVYYLVTYEPPKTFSLEIDSWQCSISHEREVQVCAKTCSWQTQVICDQWSRK